MKLIQEQRIALDQLKSRLEPEQYFSRQFQKHREFDILSSAIEQLCIAQERIPESYVEGERPDFTCFWADGTEAFPVEVTEVLRPDYRRGDFWRKQAATGGGIWSPAPPLENPWVQLRAAVSKKASKSYPVGTWLLVYFNIGTFSFRNWGEKVSQQLITEVSSLPVVGLDSFSRVLVLLAGMDGVVEIHPRVQIIG